MAEGVLEFGPHDGQRLKAKPGQERTEYVEQASGLRLTVTANGARTWSVAYWSPTAKTSRRLKLGDAETMPLKEARKQARAYRTAVEQEGRDPFAERQERLGQERQERQQRAQERQAKAQARKRTRTMERLCLDFIEHRRTTPGGLYGRVARPNTIDRWNELVRLYVSAEGSIGSVTPDRLTKGQVVAMLERAARRGSSVPKNLLEFLSAVWRWARDRADILGIDVPAASPFVGLPVIGEPRKPRERHLEPDEIRLLWEASKDDRPAHGLRLMLLTGCRVREANDLPASEIDRAKAVWNLPANRNKGGRERVTPLSKEALAVIEAAKPAKNGLVFGTEKAERTMLRLRPRMKALAKKHGIKYDHWQPRDLRRTAATQLAALGVAESIISRALGHANRSGVSLVTLVYQRHKFEAEVREALDNLGAWVATTVKGTSRK